MQMIPASVAHKEEFGKRSLERNIINNGDENCYWSVGTTSPHDAFRIFRPLQAPRR